MNKILLISLLSSTLSANFVWAQDASEEAIILNQELQFLEERANDVAIVSAPKKSELPETTNAETQSDSEIQGLEAKYFGNELEDTVTTQRAGIKRRSPNP